MVHRGVALPIDRSGVVSWVVALLAATLLLSSYLAVGANGSETPRCERFEAASQARWRDVSGAGSPVLVIGDSWSAGLGLSDLAASWPSQLPGRVHVAGFSGSGFSEGASPCGAVSFADRAPAALRGLHGRASLVIVEGGLNDFDQPSLDVRAGFRRLARALHGHRVVVVGPASAPSRVARVPRVDALLARLSREAGFAYVRTSGLRLPFLRDDLHLTPAGHRIFGRYVARRISG